VGTDRRNERAGDGEVAVAPKRKVATPKRCRVILYNDDYTTQEFVVHLLETLFRKSPAEAMQVMLKVHVEGRGVAGVYPHEVAETKVLRVHESARAAGFPLRADLEDE
jgi:ATP-dependent Clp protease adaptor protein ClpS